MYCTSPDGEPRKAADGGRVCSLTLPEQMGVSSSAPSQDPAIRGPHQPLTTLDLLRPMIPGGTLVCAVLPATYSTRRVHRYPGDTHDHRPFTDTPARGGGQRPVGLGRDDRQLGCGAHDLAGKRQSTAHRIVQYYSNVHTYTHTSTHAEKSRDNTGRDRCIYAVVNG
jgi:hypothetical protein